MSQGAGLRERKKQRTREAIATAAMRLFAERGYEQTTIADIAAAADIAPRTFFAYFPSKEDVVFHDVPATEASFVARLRDRAEGETAIDAMRAWLGELVEHMDVTSERFRSRRELLRDHPSLAARDRHYNARFQRILAAAVADDLGDPPDALRPRMVAAAAVAALDTLEQHADSAAVEADPLAVVDDALVFLRGGLAALQAAGRA